MTPRQSSLPPVVFAMMVLNALFFLWQQVDMRAPLLNFALWPAVIPGGDSPFAVWQIFTYAFLHGGLFHLFVNMFALWMFGVPVENTLGSRAFAIYYVGCVIGAGLLQLVVATVSVQQGMPPYPTVGASGAVFGILLAFGMFFPNQTVMLLFPPIPMKAKYFVIVFGAFELWAGITGSFAGVAHFAHLGGMVFGFFLIQYWRGRLPIKPERRLML